MTTRFVCTLGVGVGVDVGDTTSAPIERFSIAHFAARDAAVKAAA
ncbi:hypothetical protein [Burkholderia stagnalis]|nr:hypothetical protein [Burkholderia stagnalis]